MAPNFGRSISFPLSPARSSSRAARHVRSISLPCRSHPLLAHLQTHISAVRAWAADPSTAAAPSAGLAGVGALHASLAELLLLPEPQDAVRGATAASDRLLDAFLLLADAHRGFQETLLALKADVADVQAATRRRDAARLASAARSQRRNEKELARLAANVSSGAAKCARLGLIAGTTNAGDTEMAAALMDAVAASAAASAAVFSAAASMSASTSSTSKKTTAFAAFTKKSATETAEAAPEKLEELSRCIHECEAGSEMVFRSIVRTRVSLLNILTPTI